MGAPSRIHRRLSGPAPGQSSSLVRALKKKKKKEKKINPNLQNGVDAIMTLLSVNNSLSAEVHRNSFIIAKEI